MPFARGTRMPSPCPFVNVSGFRNLAIFKSIADCHNVVVEPGAEQTLRVMMQKPLLHHWILAGHGDGGALAARLCTHSAAQSEVSHPHGSARAPGCGHGGPQLHRGGFVWPKG